MSKKIGILGGMGPYATIDLFEKIVKNTSAQKDQEHLELLIYNNPKIPPRVGNENPLADNPLPELIKSALLLEQAGADFIIMPCHTAHKWISEIRNRIRIPFYSLIENTVESIHQKFMYNNSQRILLLATSTTIQARLYQEAFKNSLFEIIIPNQEEQVIVDRAIMDVKAGKLDSSQNIKRVNDMINTYSRQGISLVLGSCTEIPVMFPHFQTKVDLLDPTLMLAKMAVQKAL